MPKQNTKPADYPQAVIQQIELLAYNIVVARKRRKETQAQWANRLGVSQPTMARIEKGDPSVAMASYVMCMWLINPAASLADLIAPQLDAIALEREVAKVRPRNGVPHRPRKPHGDAVATRSTKTGVNADKKTAGGLDASSFADAQMSRQQSTAAEIARNMGIGALAALEAESREGKSK